MASRVHQCLAIFSLISGLSINFTKSSALGIGMDSDFVVEIANDLHCRSTSLPMNYFGLPIGGKIVYCSSWDHVVELFRARLT